jgi:hypothetical protein
MAFLADFLFYENRIPFDSNGLNKDIEGFYPTFIRMHNGVSKAMESYAPLSLSG